MMKKTLFILIFIFCNFSLQAEVTIKFISYVDVETGLKEPLFQGYPDEERYHVAVKINNYWYQMLPWYGFIKSESFELKDPEIYEKDGKTYQVFVENYVNASLTLPDPDIGPLQNLKFDLFSEWNDPLTSHCSKLVGKLLGFSPKKLRELNPSQNENLSPDDIFDYITKGSQWKLIK